MPSDTPATATAAETIVDGILDAVEKAGRFDGKGRKLMLMSIVHRSGEVEGVRDRLVAWTGQQIARDPALAAMREALKEAEVMMRAARVSLTGGRANLSVYDAVLHQVQAALRLAQPAAADAGEGRG